MKVIRDEAMYARTLSRVGQLAASDPDPGSIEGEELQVLSILLEDYERRVSPIEAPTQNKQGKSQENRPRSCGLHIYLQIFPSFRCS